VGYRRLKRLEAATALTRLYAMARLFANFFQPSFKLAEKERNGARVRKRYHRPAPPCQWLLAETVSQFEFPGEGQVIGFRPAAPGPLC
jgi:hypothetical protein